MAYLDVPRVHFSGKFLADPSTIDNNPNDFKPNAPLSNDPKSDFFVGWNPQGSHTFGLADCAVRAAVDVNGQVKTAGDPLVGARVESVLTKYKYPAKLVDLDVDQQSVSQIWGLQLQVRIPDPADPDKTLASVTGEMPATAFCDMWTRVRGGPAGGIPGFSAVYQTQLTNLTWVNPAASAVLAKLQQMSPQTLALRLIVDSYQADSNQANFGRGRVVGTIGPVFANEPTAIVLGRRLSAPASAGGGSPPYGAALAKWDGQRSVLIVDLGNFAPTMRSNEPTVPAEGWPVRASTFLLGYDVNPAAPVFTPLAQIPFGPAQYVDQAGILDIAVAQDHAQALQSAPLVLIDVTDQQNPIRAAAEDGDGLSVDVSLSFLRLNPGESQTVTLTATRFGKPEPGLPLSFRLLPQGDPDPNNQPATALPIPDRLVTGADGTAALVLTASDPGTPRANRFLDGQLYFIGGPWMYYGNIYPLQSAPITALVFSRTAVPARPTWDEHIRPIFEYYATVYPYMKTILDLADYDTLTQSGNPARLGVVLNLPVTHPHYMPVLRDLSADKLLMINNWLDLGMPRN